VEGTTISRDIQQSKPAYPDRSPWWWVPTLYFAEGIPYVLVMTVSVIMYKNFGVDNAQIGWYTSLLYLPWVIKPLWGPLVDLYGTKRNWTLVMQILLAVTFAILAVVLQSPFWWHASLAALVAAAFLSATHDIAADGFYMLGMDSNRQAFFVGIRSTFYRFAMITGQGLLVILAGLINSQSGPAPHRLPIVAGPARVEREAPAAPADGFVVFEPSVISIDAGTTQAVLVRLRAAPETTTVVTISRVQRWYQTLFPVGDALMVKVDKGDRIVFSPDDWSAGRELIVDANKKLSEPVSLAFEARAGDIALSWTVVFGAMAALFGLLFLYHLVAIPRSSLDRPELTNRPPFVSASAILLLTMIGPMVIVAGGYFGVREYMLARDKARVSDFTLYVRAVQGLRLSEDQQKKVAELEGRFREEFQRLPASAQALPQNAITKANADSDPAVKPLRDLHVSYCRLLSGLLTDQQKAKLQTNLDVLWVMYSAATVLVGWLLLGVPVSRKAIIGAFSVAGRASGLNFHEIFLSFFRKPGVGMMLAFLLLYRLGEAMLIKMASPFLMDAREVGGLGLSTAQVGLAYGTVGILALTAGGILGGIAAATGGLRRWLLPMWAAINAPDLLYVYMAYAQPEHFLVVLLCVAGEQLGYGFGFTAYMVYMLFIAGEGEHKTSHFAICTGFMALGMMLPGAVSGIIQQAVGYELFFIIVCLLTLPALATLRYIPLDPDFGKKRT
jgi:MFS family permease